MPTARQTAAQKRAAATIAALPAREDDDEVLYADEPDDLPEPGLERVDRQVTERTSLVRPVAPTGPAVVEVEDLPATDLLAQLLKELGPSSGTYIFIYREPDPPNSTYRKPYYGRKQEYTTRLAFDDRHNTFEAIYETIQRMHGGGEYSFVAREPSGQIRGRWQAAVSDLTDHRLDQPHHGNAAPIYIHEAAPVAPAPVGPSPAPVDPFAGVEKVFGMFGTFQKAMKTMTPEPPPVAPAINPVDQINSQVSFVETLLTISERLVPKQPAGSVVAEVVEKLGLGEVVTGLGKAIPGLMQYALNWQAAKNGPPATNGAAGATNHPAVSTPAGQPPMPPAGITAGPGLSGPSGPAVLSIPIPASLVEALDQFIAQLVHDGQRGVQPGIAAQMAEDYAQRFPVFREQIMQFFGAGADPGEETFQPMIAAGMGLNEAVSRIVIGTLSHRMQVDLIAFPPMLGYVMDLREAVLDVIGGGQEGEVAELPAVDPNAGLTPPVAPDGAEVAV